MKGLILLIVMSAVAPTWLAAAAQDPIGPPPANDDVANVRRKVEVPEDAGRGDIGLEVAVEAKTAYFFRGYSILDAGYIVQPEATVSLPMFEWEKYSLSPYVGVWNNISEAKGDDSSVWSHWTEFDTTVGFEVERGGWSLDVQWNYYTSPSDFFDSSHELGATLAFSGNVAGLRVNPHAAVFREFQDETDGDENTYLEVGLEPVFQPSERLSLTVPLTLGMSLDGYYTDRRGRNESLGYASIGARPAYRLGEHWSVYAGVEYLHLFADSARAANGDEDGKVVGVIGVSFNH
jgi:hypothetical protein